MGVLRTNSSATIPPKLCPKRITFLFSFFSLASSMSLVSRRK